MNPRIRSLLTSVGMIAATSIGAWAVGSRAFDRRLRSGIVRE